MLFMTHVLPGLNNLEQEPVSKEHPYDPKVLNILRLFHFLFFFSLGGLSMDRLGYEPFSGRDLIGQFFKAEVLQLGVLIRVGEIQGLHHHRLDRVALEYWLMTPTLAHVE